MLIDPRDDKYSVESHWTRGERIAIVLILIAVLTAIFLLPRLAKAHSQWISWIPSTGCIPDVSPSECVTTGFRVEIQNGATWISTPVLPVTQHNFFYEDLSAGQHFWRAFQRSATGESPPSNIVTVTFVDSTVPQPPATPRVTMETDAYRVTTNYSTFTFGKGSLSGKVALNTPCEARTVGNGYYYVLKKYITSIPGVSKPDYNVVKCSN